MTSLALYNKWRLVLFQRKAGAAEQDTGDFGTWLAALLGGALDEMTFLVGDRTVAAAAGSFVFVPRKVAHAFRVDSPTARFLLIVVPKLSTERTPR